MSQDPIRFYDNYLEDYRRPEGYFLPIVDAVLRNRENQLIVGVLDIGCGYGDFLRAFGERLGDQVQLTGITIAPHESQAIQEKNAESPHPVEVILGRQQDLQALLPDRRFDVVVCFNTLSYLRPQEQLETLAHQILPAIREGGILVLGLMDHWIAPTYEISNAGEGYVQFHFHPALLTLLGDRMRLQDSWIEPRNGYRVQAWVRSPPSISGRLVARALKLSYVTRYCMKQIRKRLKLRTRLARLLKARK
jgi:SAM-dependent methyltransferase